MLRNLQNKHLILIASLIFLGFLGFFSFAEDNLIYNAKGKHNPFIPLVTPEGRILKLDYEEEGETSLLLEGIIYDKNNISYAIVNGRVVKKGDRIADAEVLEIEETKVIFVKNGRKFELGLKKEAEK